MITLSDTQIELIYSDIKHNGIELIDLQDDLLDHICCALEEEMESVSSFEAAYLKVKQLVCPNGFREIQEETNHLLTLKFNKIKKTMNALGTIGSLALLTGSTLKSLHMSGGGIILLLGSIILSFGYLPFILFMSMKLTDTAIGKIRNIIGFTTSLTIIIGVVFKIMFWPAARLILFSGIISFILFFIPLFVRSIGKNAVVKIQPITSSILLMAITSILFAFSNQAKSNDMIEIDSNFVNQIESLNEHRQSIGEPEIVIPEHLLIRN